ncbi:MAG TPA: helix-turn-helix transcriptional regulator [Euzebya sp.]|nr:helix-turn-helix transcriptional regulator [Euzebya sp.]
MSESSMDTAQELASRVARRRAELGLTQQEAADMAGVAVTTWRMVEGGRQSNFRALTLASVARALGLEVDHLLDPSSKTPATRPARPAVQPPDHVSRGTEATVALLAEQLVRLSPRDLLLIQALVDRLFEDHA